MKTLNKKYWQLKKKKEKCEEVNECIPKGCMCNLAIHIPGVKSQWGWAGKSKMQSKARKKEIRGIKHQLHSSTEKIREWS